MNRRALNAVGEEVAATAAGASGARTRTTTEPTSRRQERQRRHMNEPPQSPTSPASHSPLPLPDSPAHGAPPGTPWGPPVPDETLTRAAVPVAWLGRTSTEDSQDPTLSLPRQLRNARAALPPGWVIVAHFYDIESGRKDLATRGRGHAHENFNIPIPRDGGITDLLEEAKSPDRRFAAVICESIERVARRTYFGTKIEFELDSQGVALCAADEPIMTDSKAKRATPTLTRRVKQAVAEWYVLQMLELSWDGFIEHTQQGWNIGKPPYGYLADRVPHPVPARRAEGRTKHKLVPDRVRGPVVTEIFRMRALERLGYRSIADRLNHDPDKYPPPAANRGDASVGHWTVQSVRGILTNPKYTGYQVWNRRARKKRGNRANPVSEWVWSPRPVHEPLVTRELFNVVWAEPGRQGSRSGAEPNTHPATTRTYPLRSYVVCALCGRRMFGKVSKGHAHYVCYRDELRRSEAEWFERHPKALWVSEKILLGAVHWFFAERVLGPQREQHLRAQLAAEARTRQLPEPADDETADRVARLREQAAVLERRQEALLDQLAEEDGTGDPETTRAFRQGIRSRYDRLGGERRTLAAELDSLQAAQTSASSGGRGREGLSDPELINFLPVLTTRFAELPEAAQRKLYDAFRLEVRYNRNHREVGLTVTIPAAIAADLGELTRRTVMPPPGGAHGDQPGFERPRQDSNLRPSA
ncbi:recombinase family protein [Streptomyces sp. BH055]|uniref:recombinase family protein n=1 Tax=Streptomyces sp. BH055 TaxID=3401173 RepID=UPI003BB49AD0